jgi:hypothetical protein
LSGQVTSLIFLEAQRGAQLKALTHALLFIELIRSRRLVETFCSRNNEVSALGSIWLQRSHRSRPSRP